MSDAVFAQIMFKKVVLEDLKVSTCLSAYQLNRLADSNHNSANLFRNELTKWFYNIDNRC